MKDHLRLIPLATRRSHSSNLRSIHLRDIFRRYFVTQMMRYGVGMQLVFLVLVDVFESRPRPNFRMHVPPYHEIKVALLESID